MLSCSCQRAFEWFHAARIGPKAVQAGAQPAGYVGPDITRKKNEEVIIEVKRRGNGLVALTDRYHMSQRRYRMYQLCGGRSRSGN